MPRVLTVTNDFPPRHGGIETYVGELTRRFDPDDVVVFTPDRPGAAQWDAACPFEVIRTPIRFMLPVPPVVRAVAQVIASHRIDAVWFAAGAPLGLMAPALRRTTAARRFVATTHGHEVWWARLPGTRGALRRMVDGLDHTTYITDYTRAAIAPALSPQGLARLAHLSPGVTPEEFAAPIDPSRVRRLLGIGERPMVLGLSRLVPRKGQDTLITAWPEVLRHHPDAVLVLAGAGPYAGALSELIRTTGVSGSVRMVGPVPERAKRHLLAAASAFAMPARSRFGGLEVEGLGIVYLEAAAAGLPVIVGNSGGAPEAVRDGETGYVVDGENPAQVADRIARLLDDPELARAMGREGQEWMREQWTWDQRAALLIDLLTVG
jgi:phosphatidylinositol alpha-1,6-mannosyltransferase